MNPMNPMNPINRLTVQHPALKDSIVADFAGLMRAEPESRAPDVAIWHTASMPDKAAVAALAEASRVDAHVQHQPAALRDFRFMAFDMDSTVITIECIDEIADYAGRKDEVAGITAAAMRGEITDYADSLRQRVALLEGLPESVLLDVYEQRLTLSPGIERLLTACRKADLKTLLVSGGFTFYTDRLRDRLGFDQARSNVLDIANGRLTGKLVGDIVGPEAKRETVLAATAALGCPASQAIVIGDGANDLPMMGVAGMSVAYHAKPVVQRSATHALNYCGLDAVLNFFRA